MTVTLICRLGSLYASHYDIFVTQHDVLRDLALHLSNAGKVNRRKRLLMPKRELDLPGDWERNNDEHYIAQIVSIHTGKCFSTLQIFLVLSCNNHQDHNVGMDFLFCFLQGK